MKTELNVKELRVQTRKGDEGQEDHLVIIGKSAEGGEVLLRVPVSVAEEALAAKVESLLATRMDGAHTTWNDALAQAREHMDTAQTVIATALTAIRKDVGIVLPRSKKTEE